VPSEKDETPVPTGSFRPVRTCGDQASPALGRGFSLVLSGQAASLQGDGLANAALLWRTACETGSAAAATQLILAATSPIILLGPAAGVGVASQAAAPLRSCRSAA